MVFNFCRNSIVLEWRQKSRKMQLLKTMTPKLTPWMNEELQCIIWVNQPLNSSQVRVSHTSCCWIYKSNNGYVVLSQLHQQLLLLFNGVVIREQIPSRLLLDPAWNRKDAEAGPASGKVISGWEKMSLEFFWRASFSCLSGHGGGQ